MGRTIREAYGEALVKYGKTNRNFVVLDADVSGSTRSALFGQAFPHRFFNVGIAESNMVAMAGGFAAVGQIPFANTFAVFMTSIGLIAARAFGSYSGLGIKLVGAYGGLSDSFDGPSHHSVEDIAIMRSLPGFQVYVASDNTQVEWLVANALEHGDTPMYIRLSREAHPDLYSKDEAFAAGKGRIVREGSELTIIACGSMVSKALAASDALKEKGVSVRVVDMFCIKPLDKELVLDCAKGSKAIITAEEHSVIGGLGGAVAEALCEAGAKVPVGFIGMQDCHAECGPYSDLLRKYGLDELAIINKASSMLGLD